MANFFMNMANSFGDWMAGKIAGYLNDQMGRDGMILRSYYKGNHRPQLKAKMNKDGTANDDNIIQNWIGLAVDRSVSRLYRGGVTWKLPDGKTKQQDYLDAVWRVNKKDIILYQYGLHGSVYGTPYFKIVPQSAIDSITGEIYPKLIPLDPEIVRIKPDPQDMDTVLEYRIEFTIRRDNGMGQIQEVSYREITRRANLNDYGENAREVMRQAGAEPSGWIVEEWEQVGGGQWTMTNKTVWAYDFPPIIHSKNLPSLKSCYGDSDIDDAINIQDKSNFVVSNTGKIIKYHAHPQTIGTGFSVKDMQSMDGAVGSFHAIPAEGADVKNLEMQSDLASSREFANDLRQSIFDISREPDISSMKDKIGQLTNFGLRVLWDDSLSKTDLKHKLYGEAFKELNRRLLVLNNWTGAESDPGEVQWGESAPVNIKEELDADKQALEMRIVDRETVYTRYQSRYGKSWDDIKAKLEEEQAEAAKNNENIGGQILQNFNRGTVEPRVARMMEKSTGSQMMRREPERNR